MKPNIPYGYCQCGCGQKTRVMTFNDRRNGYLKGQPMRYISGHNLEKGTKHNHYNNGLNFNKARGRWYVVCRDGSSFAFARAVMEAKLKRKLLSTEIVHHIDGDRTNDDPDNLSLCSSIFEHCSISHRGYTRENMIKLLRDYAKKLGRVPRRDEMDNVKDMPNGKTYYRRFGSWENALKEAKLA